MMIEQEKAIVKILYLRKLLKRQIQTESRYSFPKIGLGVTKYEICPNLKYFRQFEKVQTIQQDSSNLRNYCIKQRNLKSYSIPIQKIDSYYTQIEQIFNDKLVISGGHKDNHNRFIIYSNNKGAQQYEMQFKRLFHRTTFNKRNQIYIISGRDESNKQKSDVYDCEVFNLRSQTFLKLKQILTPVVGFGCDNNISKIHVFGGYN